MKNMRFKDTNEYLYLRNLSQTFDFLLSMINNNEFSQEQLGKLKPILNQINDVLNGEF